MFSSIASFIFGSSTTESTNCKPIKISELQEGQNCNLTHDKQREGRSEKHSKTNETNVEYQGRRKSNKRNNRKNKNNKHVLNKIKPVNSGPNSVLDVLTSASSDADFDLGDDWFLVEKEDVNSSSSKEDLSLAEHYNRTSTPISEISDFSTVHQDNSNNTYQNQQKNFEKHNCDLTSGFIGASIRPTAISKFRNTTSKSDVDGSNKSRLFADNSVNEPLHTVADNKDLGHNLSCGSSDSNGSGAKLFTMVDSWYMTPPPCFVSTGPIYMEMSPFENLLIEHPSMSIYHSIKAAQKASECFANFDLEADEISQTQADTKENFNPLESHAIIFVKPSSALLGQKTDPSIGKSAKTPRIDNCNATKLKMELFALNSQKSLAISDRRNLRRNAILRANQVREIQGRSAPRRRTDMQHSRVISGANNNRKCC
ncbi:uncharacterized protein LOC105213482 [Zeugodacus cucurbitae]|uniref:uncharacterized protein LOC105213482 n=1 Tax=Zeugodacus cucurbitae TaxID=28588 RepID=UPI0023D8E757|nr:uncharacterized protein LOC105213482 [Zeugodacus cucurbitae]XP_028897001.2 uncharacterized protein LOC105213482 [Zeugodacus cucurbitae]XP_028897002.2 uncharacterized protein LOC105213482 [Zeugodacus cucurbitae]XP_028897003.2 uncharacterized protein LOC105213482 [Zeugodacus cucurbitae]XP_028897004.2 uncharacterized protein LOC105213482 [Zeugodacus cucurbitae]